jgi:hypothetical protein
MPARDPSKPDDYYCNGTRHKADCVDKTACDGCAPPCSARAGAGTSHVGVGCCSRHLGSTKNHVRAAEVVLARQAVERYGLAVDIDPAAALMRAVATSYGSVLFMEAQVQALEKPWSDDDGGRPHVAWTMLMAERKHNADVCRDALRAGVERRAMEAMEDTARLHVAMLEVFVAAAKLDRHDPVVIAAGHAAMRVLPGGA